MRQRERDMCIAAKIRDEYNEATRLLEMPGRSLQAKTLRLKRMLGVLGEWFERDFHNNPDVGLLVTERGIAAFNAALADVLPALPERSVVQAERKTNAD